MTKLHHTDRYLTEADFRLLRAIGQAAVVMLAAIPAAGVAAMTGVPALFLLAVGAFGLALMALFGIAAYVAVQALLRLCTLGRR